MRPARELVRRALFRHGWDTRCRHWSSTRVLREAIAALPRHEGPVLLDVGSGGAGMAAFLHDVSVTGVDIEPPGDTPPNMSFTQASVAALPFADRSFPYVSCVDVLQALPEDVRARGLSEMLRVARDGLLIATPQGSVAARCDAEFERRLTARGRRVPAWVAESQAQPYPTLDAVLHAIDAADPSAEVSVSFNEPASVCRAVRGAAARSDALYAAANLLFGLLVPLVPEPAPERAYRVVVHARLGDAHRSAASAVRPQPSV